MIVKSVLNEEALKGMGIRVVGDKKLTLTLVTGALTVVFGGVEALRGQSGGVIFAVLLAAVLAANLIWSRHRTVKLTLNRLAETWDSRDISLTMDFPEKDSFAIVNPSTEKKTEVKYSCLKKLWERSGYAYLWTNALQFFAIPLEQFESAAQKQQFYALLRKQAPAIRIKAKQ